MTSERRKHKRVVASFPCLLAGPDKQEEPFDLVDLSESGVRLRCARSLPPMTQIQVALVLPGARVGRPQDTRLSTRGVVVWSHKAAGKDAPQAKPKKSGPAKAGAPERGFDTGVFFPELSADERRLLLMYVVTAAS